MCQLLILGQSVMLLLKKSQTTLRCASLPGLLAAWVMCCTTLCTSTAQADLIAYEGFDYEVGSVIRGGDGGSGWGDVWGAERRTERPLIASGSISYPGLQSSGNHLSVGTSGTGYASVFRSLASPITSDQYDSVWISFLVAREAGSNSYAAFELAMGNDWLLGIGDLGGDGLSPSSWAAESSDDFQLSDVAVSSSVRMMVAQIDFVNQRANLWIDPLLAGGQVPAASASQLSLDIDFDSFDRIQIYSDGGGMYRFDEIRIGTTFASVAAVPEPSSAVLAGLALVGLGYGWRRRCSSSKNESNMAK